ncbi:MAG TPA: hypothetical protein VIQ31_06605 [Phormidium sp.]
MGTNNPKVSAYVPEAIKNRLTQFTKEQNLSESQAVTRILAQYFGMTEVLGQSSQETPGVTLGRMEALEEGFASFAESVDRRLQELGESVKKLSELRVDLDRQEEAVINSQQTINQVSELLARSEPIQLELHQVKQLDIDAPPDEAPVKVEQAGEKDNPALTLLSELPSELQQEEIKPIPGTKLSKLRFGRSRDTLAGVKRKMPPQEFTEWTRNEDPDKIAWEHTPKGYVPIGELTDEQKSSLLRWYKENL